MKLLAQLGRGLEREHTTKMTKLVFILIVVLLGITVLLGTEATQYTVGDSTGWQNPPSTNYYSNWASSKTFSVGDTLVFNFISGHTVAGVTKAIYDSCNVGNVNSNNVTSTGPATISLTATGMHYYVCTVSGHCQLGQKLAVSVSNSNSSSPSGSPSSPGSNGNTNPSPPPPPSNSASNFAACFGLMVLSNLAIAFLL